MVFNRLRFIVDDNNTDVLESRTGGLDRLAVLTGCHNRVGMAVNHEIDAGDFIKKINRTVTVGCGFRIDTKVAQAEYEVNFLLLQAVDSDLGAGIQIIKGGEGDILDQAGIDFCCGFGRLHTEEAKLKAAFCLNHLRGIVDGFTSLIEIDIRADDGEIGTAQVFLQLLEAIVKFMVAEGGDVIACSIHHSDCACAFGQTYIDGALAEVTSIYHVDFRPGCFEGILQSSHNGIAFNLAMNVIAVENNSFAGEIAVVDFCIGCIVIVCRGRDCEGKNKNQRKDKCQDFARFFHSLPPF